MYILTSDALMLCRHVTGRVQLSAGQDFVRIAERPVLVDDDPEHRQIVGCPNAGPGNPPCLHTLAVREGYSDFVRVAGRAVCLDTVTGLTDGFPPGTHRYFVKNPGQTLVRSRS